MSGDMAAVPAIPVWLLTRTYECSSSWDGTNDYGKPGNEKYVLIEIAILSLPCIKVISLNIN